jgi:hypothetical protein
MTALEEPLDPESLDRLLSALSTEPNRRIVQYFRDSSDETVALDDLAGHVSEMADRPPDRVALRLHHAALPKLAGAGLLEYDRRTQTARRLDHPILEVDDVSEILDVP